MPAANIQGTYLLAYKLFPSQVFYSAGRSSCFITECTSAIKVTHGAKNYGCGVNAVSFVFKLLQAPDKASH